MCVSLLVRVKTSLTWCNVLNFTLYNYCREVIIPRGNASEVPGVGKVFVEFDTPQQSHAAYTALSGRKFGPNIVMALYMNEAKFAARDLTV